jgi:hypothetical protein
MKARVVTDVLAANSVGSLPPAGAFAPLPVIPGRAEGASPESLTTDRYAFAPSCPNATIVVMDSGLLASLGPGMTIAHSDGRLTGTTA